jgi:hypothetical protein
MSITNLYRSSRSTSKRAYNSGYAAACADLLQMIQQGVSDSETPPSIGRVMDWVEARLEAIRAREEEEDEEDEESAASKKEKDGQTGPGRLKASSSLPRANSAPAVPQQAHREQVSSLFPLHSPSHSFLFLSTCCLYFLGRFIRELSGIFFCFFPVAGTPCPIKVVTSSHHRTDCTITINTALSTGYHHTTASNSNNSSRLAHTQITRIRIRFTS